VSTYQKEVAMIKKAHSLKIFREVPHGAKVFKAFSLEESLCQDKLEQAHTLPIDAWVFLGYESFFRTVEKAEKAWPFVSLEIRLDGEKIDNPKDYTTGPYGYSLICPKGEKDGFVVGTAIYVPGLLAGDHHIEWKIKYESDIDDGWVLTPGGTVMTISAVLHVINKRFVQF
jgi:hypothetical protein